MKVFLGHVLVHVYGLCSSPCVGHSHVLCVVDQFCHRAALFLLALLAGILFLAAGSCPYCDTNTHTHGQGEARMQIGTHIQKQEQGYKLLKGSQLQTSQVKMMEP